MTRLTRRGFFKQTSVNVGIGAAALGMLTTLSRLEVASTRSNSQHAIHTLSPENLVAHVRDFATGEIALMVGTTEVIVHNPELVQRLLQATR